MICKPTENKSPDIIKQNFFGTLWLLRVIAAKHPNTARNQFKVFLPCGRSISAAIPSGIAIDCIFIKK
jgi:hypothetical protein